MLDITSHDLFSNQKFVPLTPRTHFAHSSSPVTGNHLSVKKVFFKMFFSKANAAISEATILNGK